MAAPPFAIFEGWDVRSSHPCLFIKFYIGSVTQRLRRCYGAGYLHFITSSCYQRRPLLGSAHHRDLFLETLEEVRRRYHFIVVGYVVMPEHIHLLMSESEQGNPSTVMQVLKQRTARKLMRAMGNLRSSEKERLSFKSDHVWQKRFYDFVIWNPA